MANKTVKCIKNGETGECFDIVDEGARTEIGQIKESINALTGIDAETFKNISALSKSIENLTMADTDMLEDIRELDAKIESNTSDIDMLKTNDNTLDGEIAKKVSKAGDTMNGPLIIDCDNGEQLVTWRKGLKFYLGICSDDDGSITGQVGFAKGAGKVLLFKDNGIYQKINGERKRLATISDVVDGKGNRVYKHTINLNYRYTNYENEPSLASAVFSFYSLKSTQYANIGEIFANEPQSIWGGIHKSIWNDTTHEDMFSLGLYQQEDEYILSFLMADSLKVLKTRAVIAGGYTITEEDN